MPNPVTSTYTPDSLVAGDFPQAFDTVTLLSGQDLKRGAVVGKVTASGKYKLSASEATDGSQTPVAVLEQDCDASAGDAPAVIKLTGDVRGAALTLGAGHTVASVKAALRPLSIFVR
jgi:hypothetical protein